MAIDDAANRRLADLDRVRDDRSPEALAARAERMNRVLAGFGMNVNPDLWLTDDDLYDELGLPK